LAEIHPNRDSQSARTRRASLLRRARSFLVLFSILFAAGAACAQNRARVQFENPPTKRARITGALVRGEKIWSFRGDYAGVSELGARVENFSLTDERGAPVEFRRIAPGEFVAARDAVGFSYEMKLDAPANPNRAPFVSWLTTTCGVLQFGDLLPRALHGRTKVEFALPAEWRVESSALPAPDGSYELSDAESAVFLIARNASAQDVRAPQLNLRLAQLGSFAFSDAEAAQIVSEIINAELKIFGAPPAIENPRAAIFILPFPVESGAANSWSAATRGSTVIFCSGKLPSKIAALANLQAPLAHELFHLWIPNALALENDYSWFYEGFTLYEAAQINVRLGYLSFQDFLAAIARAFDAYRNFAAQRNLSLIEASRRRWSGTETLVYNKGMVAAFLYDLTLRWKTDGKGSLADVYRALLARHHSTQPRADGNAALIKILSDEKAMREFVNQYIAGTDAIDLAQMLAPFGLSAEQSGARTQIKIAAHLQRNQKRLLRELGYNG
jgi:predicted metalloprotease with PDZ domain